MCTFLCIISLHSDNPCVLLISASLPEVWESRVWQMQFKALLHPTHGLWIWSESLWQLLWINNRWRVSSCPGFLSSHPFLSLTYLPLLQFLVKYSPVSGRKQTIATDQILGKLPGAAQMFWTTPTLGKWTSLFLLLSNEDKYETSRK